MARLEAGETNCEVAAALKVAVSSVIKWTARKRRLGSPAPGKMGGHRPYRRKASAVRAERSRARPECDAPWVLNGPINGEAFRLYVETQLIKTLKPGDIVVLDNLGSHKGAAVRDTVRAAGARLSFLRPYSPDLNPIEQLFMRRQTKRRGRPQRHRRNLECTHSTGISVC